MKIFGNHPEGRDVIVRPGIYGLVMSEGKVAVVKNSLGFFMLGGGVEEGESEEACLRREVLEETGYTINIKERLESVEEYVHVVEWNESYRKVMNFYRIELVDKVAEPTEEDHEMLWFEPLDAVRLMYLKGQAYVIQTYATN